MIIIIIIIVRFLFYFTENQPIKIQKSTQRKIKYYGILTPH